MNTFLIVYFIVLSTIFGIVIGSFLNVVIYRIPEGRTVVKGHSMCMTCGHELTAKDLIPIISWASLKGKCRYCGAPIASRYTKIESFNGLIFLVGAICTYRYAYPVIIYPTEKSFLFYFLYFVAFLLCMSAIDSMMMIYHDTGKCYWGFPVFVASFKIATTILLKCFGLLGTDYTWVAMLKDMGASVIRVSVVVLATFILFLIMRKKYSLQDAYFDTAMAILPLYGLYFNFGNVYIFTAIHAIVYGLLRSLLKNTKWDKYVGIITVCSYLVINLIHYFVML